MRAFVRILGFALCCGLCLGLAGAQRNGLEVTATLSSGVVKLGGDVVLTVQVVNPKRTAEIRSRPDVDGLVIGRWNGPSRSSNISLFNGRRSESVTYRWQLVIRPTRLGEFEIPPVEIDVDGQALRTRARKLAVVEDLRGADLGFCELEAKERVYEGEPLELSLHCGWDRSLAVDYVNLSLPWWEQLSGFIELEETQRSYARKRTEISLNGDARRAVEVDILDDRRRDGRTFYDLELRRTFLPSRPGTYELPQSYLEFRQVIERGGFLRRDRTERFYALADPVTIEVLPLPDAGRPFGFTGAVGEFEPWADVDRRDVDVGDSIKLTVEWTGYGNFEFFEAPDLERDERFAGFRVYGKTERKSSERRTVVYDLAPLDASTTEIPAIELAVFDTSEEAYREVATEPIPIRVRALAATEGLAPIAEEEGIARDVRDIVADLSVDGALQRPGAGRVIAGLVGLPIVWLLLRTWVRRRGDPGAPAARRRRAAKRALTRALGRSESAVAQLASLDAFLAARSGESSAAWSGRDLNQYFEARTNGRSVDPDAVAHLIDVRAKLERQAYGGGDAPLAVNEVLVVADRLIGGGL